MLRLGAGGVVSSWGHPGRDGFVLGGGQRQGGMDRQHAGLGWTLETGCLRASCLYALLAV